MVKNACGLEEGTTRYSLAEIDAHCRKAARGAGCPWGLAEEAGKAARWLAERDLPGPDALAALLAAPRSCGCGGNRGPQCPLRVGAALSDTSEAITEAQTVQVAQPLIVFAMMARAAAATGKRFALSWAEADGVCGPEGISLQASGNALSDDATLHVAPTDATPSATAPGMHARAVSGTCWAALERYARRTYAPATEASRRQGAGAGTSDND